MSAYAEQIDRVLPRLLALYDRNPVSSTRGVGDRYRWAWKLSDFANGTFQGACHGLARLIAAGLLPDYLQERAMVERIEEMILALRTVRERDGSVGEAFPHESSFCVTALVAFDVLVAIDLLGARLDRRCLAEVEPLISFLERSDETHATIANHLATAVAAFVRWERATGAQSPRTADLLARLLSVQHDEGWFTEYWGADPGYQTLAMHYLADVHRLRPDLELDVPLRRSCEFLAHFAHPDGSFGGVYGARNTRFVAPGGIEALARDIPAAAALAEFTRRAVRGRTIVTLETMDEPNLVPLFNSYCWAAAEERELADVPPLPSQGPPFRAVLSGAGIVVDRGERHYTVVSIHKGGVVHHAGEVGVLDDTGVVARRGELLYTTQSFDPANVWSLEADELEVVAELVQVPEELPVPWQFAALRLASVSAFRIPSLRERAKRMLVKRVITQRNAAGVRNRRRIRLGPEISIDDSWADGAGGFERISVGRPFSALHMASQGYWQAGDDR